MIKFKEGEIYPDCTDPEDAYKVIKIENNGVLAEIFKQSNPDHKLVGMMFNLGCCKDYVSGKEAEVALWNDDVMFRADKVLKKKEK